ncbi:unnamed protein product (macronuclear) [Paramecium tetraurelia]|uniref:Protein kinase domain-containing protein n=1 Tax=Paramecium tetraurelia TaxID=5888 RepID=A0DY06_PARTE|nr:uncharacterized protein GSPATT00021547001 [Paramecium tetraurelia]CAK87923.1 unnamed protein product [Paramecium tetraurelia]|eukprot:XP_001455320.1 hypothetical protein (macronuclear) [Paramecium tetraurelia strain d4-2]
MIKKKISKFTPYDRVLDGLEQEELIDEDINMKIIKVYNRKKNNKMFLLERLISNEKEHLKYIDEIHKYEFINSDGLLCIEKWTYDMLIDQNLNKLYKFILVFDTYSQNLNQYLENIQSKKIQLLKEDIVVFFRAIILSINYLQQQQIVTFNPVTMSCILICSDTCMKFNCIPILLTQHSLEKAKKESLLYQAPEQVKDYKNITHIYSQAVYSLGLIFIQLFLLRHIDQLRKFEDIKQSIKEIQLKYGDTYKSYLESMVEQDPHKRIKLYELCQTLSIQEPQKLIKDNLKITFSETFEYYRKQYSILNVPEARSIAYGIPWTRNILQSNLFKMKNYFLELLDLSQSQQISEQAVTIIFQQFRAFVIGGMNCHLVYELDDEIPALKEMGFRICYIENNQLLYICSGYSDQLLTANTFCYNIQTQKWTKLSDCQKPGIGCTLVCYNNQSIFKYGGVEINNKSLNYVEELKNNEWQLINFKKPHFILPSFSFAQQVNPTQIFIVGGYFDKVPNTKVIVMNIDTQAHHIDSRKEQTYVEFIMNEFLDYGKYGPVEAMQISTNQLFLLQKRNEKQQYLTVQDQAGFVELRKIHI